MQFKFLLFVLLLFTFSLASGAREEVEDSNKKPFFDMSLKREPLRLRQTGWPAFASLLLPGFDQWWESQQPAAGFFSGYAFSGLYLATHSGVSNNPSTTDLETRNNSLRSFMLGLQMYQTAGSLSAYHSFRTAVRTQKVLGHFQFLKHEETAGDLMLAPFRFSFLKQKTTWIPVLLVSGLAVLELSSGDSNRARHFTWSDGFFTSALSYQAGVGEEAVFRGWMMPGFQELLDNRFWSNTIQATAFSLAHLSQQNKFPWPQLLMGWYLGWLAQSNEWSLSEGIFVHAWWDVIAFTATYLDEPAKASIFMPLLHATF